MKKLYFFIIFIFINLIYFNNNAMSKDKEQENLYDFFDNSNSISFYNNSYIINPNYQFIFRMPNIFNNNIKIIENKSEQKKYTLLFTFNKYPENENIILELISINKNLYPEYKNLLKDKKYFLEVLGENNNYITIMTSKQSKVKNKVTTSSNSSEHKKENFNKDTLYSEILYSLNGVNDYYKQIYTKKINNIDMIPINDYLDILGYKLDKKTTNKKIYISNKLDKNKCFTITPENKKYKKNANKKYFEVSPKIIDEKLYVPISFLNDFR